MKEETFELFINGMVGDFYLQFAYATDDEKIALFIKALWKINKNHTETKQTYYILPHRYGFDVRFHWKQGKTKDFRYSDYNDSELETLMKALEYLYENTK